MIKPSIEYGGEIWECNKGQIESTVLGEPKGFWVRCFFTSIALNMLSDLQMWSHCMSLAGVTSHTTTLEDLTKVLRQIYVKELLGEC